MVRTNYTDQFTLGEDLGGVWRVAPHAPCAVFHSGGGAKFEVASLVIVRALIKVSGRRLKQVFKSSPPQQSIDNLYSRNKWQT